MNEPRNPDYQQLLHELAALHEAKSADYADDDNPFSNFEFAANYAGVTVMQAFDVLIGVKQARFLQLTRNNKVPKNEPLADTIKDHANYSVIKASYVRFMERMNSKQMVPGTIIPVPPGEKW